MKDSEGIKYYSPLEEKINIISHAIGFVLSFIGLVFLIRHATLYGNVWHIVSFSIFGTSLLILFAASTLYHNSKEPVLRKRMRIVDHAAIYILIAGTYTPYTLVTLHGTIGWVIFSVSWGIALIGITLKFFFTGKYNVVSTLMYVLMGWIIVFAIKPLINNLPVEGVVWLAMGGLAYTMGAIVYSIKTIKFNHAIFHLFVLFAAFCHFISVFFYVLPCE